MSPSTYSENSWYCVFELWTFIFTGTFTIANIQAGMNPITPVINQTYAEIYQQRYGEDMTGSTWTLLLSLTMSMVYVGGLVGSLLISPLLKCLTRKKAVVAMHLVGSVGLIIIAIGMKGAMSHEMVICGRFVTGVSVGLGMSLIPLVVYEIAAPHRRQTYGAAYGALIPFGGGVSTFLAWYKIFGSYEMLLGTLLYGLIFTFLFLVCVYWLYETPYQIYLQHGPDAALEALRKLRTGNEEQLRMELEPFLGDESKCADCPSESDVQQEASLKEIMTTPHYRRHFISVVTIFGLRMACGFSNVLSFADKIFLEAGLPFEVVTPATMGAFFLSSVASGVAIIAMRKFDSRSIVITCDAVIALSHALMTTSIQTSKQVPGMSWVSLAAMFLFMTAFGAVTSTSLAIMGTLCIDKTRSFCLQVGGVVFWFLAWFVGFISPYLTEWIQGYAFLIWMVMAILGILYFVFFVPQTKGKSEAEIQQFFKTEQCIRK